MASRDKKDLHIEYFNKAKEHGDKLYVIVNNDKQRELKGIINE